MSLRIFLRIQQYKITWACFHHCIYKGGCVICHYLLPVCQCKRKGTFSIKLPAGVRRDTVNIPFYFNNCHKWHIVSKNSTRSKNHIVCHLGETILPWRRFVLSKCGSICALILKVTHNATSDEKSGSHESFKSHESVPHGHRTVSRYDRVGWLDSAKSVSTGLVLCFPAPEEDFRKQIACIITVRAVGLSSPTHSTS